MSPLQAKYTAERTDFKFELNNNDVTSSTTQYAAYKLTEWKETDFRNALNESGATIHNISHKHHIFGTVRFRLAFLHQSIGHILQFPIHFHEKSNDFIMKHSSMRFHMINQFIQNVLVLHAKQTAPIHKRNHIQNSFRKHHLPIVLSQASERWNRFREVGLACRICYETVVNVEKERIDGSDGGIGV